MSDISLCNVHCTNITVNGINGISNNGNTCYLNTIIQCLMNITEIKTINYTYIENILEYIFNKIKQENLVNKKFNINSCADIDHFIKNTLTYQLINISKQLWNNETIDTHNFKKIIGNLMPIFKTNEQQDAHELLNFLLDTLYEEINCGESQNQINYNDKNIFLLQKNQYISTLINNTNKFPLLFKIITESCIQCSQCNLTKYILDVPINILSLAIPIKLPQKLYDDTININDIKDTFNKIANIKYNIIELLNYYFENEIIEDKYLCDKCGQTLNAKKETKLCLLPKILIIHIKRFLHFNLKNITISKKANNLIKFPINNLSVESYCCLSTPCDLHSSSTPYNKSYDLFAITNHIGNKDCGHYYAYVKSLTNNNWYELNDNKIICLDKDKLITNNAYILYYRLN